MDGVLKRGLLGTQCGKVRIYILIMYTAFGKTNETPKDHQKSSDILA